MGETIPNLFPKTASPDQWQRSYLFSKSANHPPAGEERTEEADTSETLVLEEAKLLAGGVASRWGDSSFWNGCRWLKGSQRRETEWTCERFEEMKTWTRSRTYQRHSTGDEQNSTVIPGDILQVMNKTLHQLNQCFPNIPLQLARNFVHQYCFLVCLIYDIWMASPDVTTHRAWRETLPTPPRLVQVTVTARSLQVRSGPRKQSHQEYWVEETSLNINIILTSYINII